MLTRPNDAQGEKRRDTRLIDAIHCRLIERATNGRLTFAGNRVVSVGGTDRELQQEHTTDDCDE